ncbi:MAG: hypothetical protein ACI86L_000883, partial [Dokdonia sp.]
MPADCIAYQKTGYFSKLICDYLDQKESLKPFYNRFPTADNLIEQATEKGAWMTALSRSEGTPKSMLSGVEVRK